MRLATRLRPIGNLSRSRFFIPVGFKLLMCPEESRIRGLNKFFFVQIPGIR